MGTCKPSEFKPFIDWSFSGSRGIFVHVINVRVDIPSSEGGFGTLFFGTLSLHPAPVPPLFLEDTLIGSAVESTNRESKVVITIGMSTPIAVWLRFILRGDAGEVIRIAQPECTGDPDSLTITGTGDDGKNYEIIISKGREIHIPTAVSHARN